MKVDGTYASLVRGVSQQSPQDRFPGQHAEQINLMPDPVSGLSRRHGTQFSAGVLLTDPDEAVKDECESWRTFVYTDAGKDYAVLYRYENAPSAVVPLAVYNLTDRLWMDVVMDTADTATVTARLANVLAVTSAGKYLMLAPDQAVTESTTDVWGDSANQLGAVVWVRGGAYSRKFNVKATLADTSIVEFEYTTPASAYQGTLDTSDIPLYARDPAGGTATDSESLWIKPDGTATLTWGTWSPSALTVYNNATAMTNVYPAAPTGTTEYSWTTGPVVTFSTAMAGETQVTVTYTHTKTIANPQYTAQVAAATSAYNSAVTAWIGTASASIQPSAIAESLRLAAISAGLTATRTDAAVYLEDVVDVVVTDNGDNSLIKGTGVKVDTITNLTAYHRPNKVVKVQARSSDDAVYFKAVPKDASTSDIVNVNWEECAGVVQTLDLKLVLGRAEGTDFFVASSATVMNTLAGVTDSPGYVVSSCGDLDSVPVPHMVGRKITMLTVFQDRLIVGTAGVIRVSRSGDYFNFFRSSLLTVLAEDGYEVSSRGREDDELRYPVIYDRDLVIFGRDAQYAVSGRSPMAATGANLAVLSSHKGAAVVPPVAAGSFVFYAKQGTSSYSLHQLQPGQVAESPEAFLVSAQVDDYLNGNVIELMHVAKPAMLVCRATGDSAKLKVFNYIDASGQGRVQDAWHTWAYNWPVAGMCSTKDGIVLFTVQQGVEGTFLVAEIQPLTSGLSDLPYLDSLSPYEGLTTGSYIDPASPNESISVAYRSGTTRRLLGGTLPQATVLNTRYPGDTGYLYAGYNYPAEVTLTNPFTKDQNGKSVTSGMLTVTSASLGLARSGGCVSTLTVEGSDPVVDSFNGRVLGRTDNIIGRETIATGAVTVPILADTKDYSLKVAARSWFPFSLTSVDWVGQFFKASRRV